MVEFSTACLQPEADNVEAPQNDSVGSNEYENRSSSEKLRSRLVYVREVPDWTYRREHIEQRSRRKGTVEPDILVIWANEAYLDPQAAVFDPDYVSKSGSSVRTIGRSDQAGFLIAVITVRDEHGRLWGATAFQANAIDKRHYLNAQEEE